MESNKGFFRASGGGFKDFLKTPLLFGEMI